MLNASSESTTQVVPESSRPESRVNDSWLLAVCQALRPIPLPSIERWRIEIESRSGHQEDGGQRTPSPIQDIQDSDEGETTDEVYVDPVVDPDLYEMARFLYNEDQVWVNESFEEEEDYDESMTTPWQHDILGMDIMDFGTGSDNVDEEETIPRGPNVSVVDEEECTSDVESVYELAIGSATYITSIDETKVISSHTIAQPVESSSQVGPTSRNPAETAATDDPCEEGIELDIGSMTLEEKQKSTIEPTATTSMEKDQPAATSSADKNTPLKIGSGSRGVPAVNKYLRMPSTKSYRSIAMSSTKTLPTVTLKSAQLSSNEPPKVPAVDSKKSSSGQPKTPKAGPSKNKELSPPLPGFFFAGAVPLIPEQKTQVTTSVHPFPGFTAYHPSESMTNRPILLNAVQRCIFESPGMNAQKADAIKFVKESEMRHFLVLCRSSVVYLYLGLYTFDPKAKGIVKVMGAGPQIVQNDTEIVEYLKFSTGLKQFVKLTSRHLSITTDGFTLPEGRWTAKVTPKEHLPTSSKGKSGRVRP